MNINIMKKLKCGLLILSTITASSISYGEESDYLSTTNIQISYAKDADNDFITGYGSDGGKRIQYRFEHQSENSWGENYVFFDVVDLESPAGAAFGEGDTNTRENYGLWNTTLQMSKIFDTDLNFGIIKDIGLEGRFEHGSFFNYKSTAFGASLYLDVPYFQGKQDKFQLTWWRRSNCDDFVTGPFGSADGSCYDNHNFWGLTTRKHWEMFGIKWSHQTFLRYQQETTSDANDPDAAARHNRIFLEIELFAQVYKNLEVGARLEHFYDEGGIDYNRTTFTPEGKSNTIPMVVIKYTFH